MSGLRRQKAGARCDRPNAFFCAGQSRLVADFFNQNSARLPRIRRRPIAGGRGAGLHIAHSCVAGDGLARKPGSASHACPEMLAFVLGSGRPRSSLKVDRSLKGLPQSWIVDPCFLRIVTSDPQVRLSPRRFHRPRLYLVLTSICLLAGIGFSFCKITTTTCSLWKSSRFMMPAEAYTPTSSSS